MRVVTKRDTGYIAGGERGEGYRVREHRAARRRVAGGAAGAAGRAARQLGDDRRDPGAHLRRGRARRVRAGAVRGAWGIPIVPWTRWATWPACCPAARTARADRNILLVAHTDTPVAATVDHTVMVQPERVIGPSVADNALGLAVVAALPAVLERLGLTLRSHRARAGPAAAASGAATWRGCASSSTTPSCRCNSGCA